MFENIIITIKPFELEKLLRDYYRKFHCDESIDISIKTTKEPTGLYEHDKIVTRIKVKRNIKLGNFTTTVAEEISPEEIESVLKEILLNTEYNIKEIRFDNHEECYGIHEDKMAVFDGLNVTLQRKSKRRVYK